MDASESARPEEKKGAAAPPESAVLHRVCIQCNNMFAYPLTISMHGRCRSGDLNLDGNWNAAYLSKREQWKRVRRNEPARRNCCNACKQGSAFLTFGTSRARLASNCQGVREHIIALDADAVQNGGFGRRGGTLFLFSRAFRKHP